MLPPLRPRALPPPQTYQEKQRPKLEQVEVEAAIDLDMYGRPKRAVSQSPLAVMPEEERQKAEQQLAAQAEKEERRAAGRGGGRTPPQSPPDA